ncbi:hypothetical protein V2J09_023069 [Rumex salicifolius]
MPPLFWIEALNTTTHLLNLIPTKTITNLMPHTSLYDSPLTYSHLRVFGCLCYPNLSSTMPHKLSPRSPPCVLLEYTHFHKGYWCKDISSNKVYILRHVIFDEFTFPFQNKNSSNPSKLRRKACPLFKLILISHKTLTLGTHNHILITHPIS